LEAPKFVPLYTVEDYRNWRGDWELIEGVAVSMAPSPSWKHQRLAFLLAKEIEEELSKCPCSVCLEVDWIVDERTVVRPDLVVVCGEVGDYLKRAPLVVFEVVSKSTAFKDETVKFELYQREKVNYYGLVYPELQKVRLFKLKNGRFEKVFEGEEGEFTLEAGDCPFTLNFGELWKRV